MLNFEIDQFQKVQKSSTVKSFYQHLSSWRVKTDVSHLVWTLCGGTSRDFYTLDVELFWFYSVCVRLSNVHKHGWDAAYSAASRFSSVSFKKRDIWRSVLVTLSKQEVKKQQKVFVSAYMRSTSSTLKSDVSFGVVWFVFSILLQNSHGDTIKIGMLSRDKSLICSYLTY